MALGSNITPNSSHNLKIAVTLQKSEVTAGWLTPLNHFAGGRLRREVAHNAA